MPKALGTAIGKRLKENGDGKANVLRYVQTAPHVLDILQHLFPDVSQSPPAEA